MESFIKTVLIDLKKKHLKLEDLHFILPSKRAGIFLKNQLSTLLDYPIFAPEILSIEAFVEELSGLQNLPNADLLFKLYEAHLTLTPEKEQEPFESFSKWAQILLQDFNEIDRFLVPQDRIFSSLNDIQQINNWSLEGEQTDLVKNYLRFWERLKDYYRVFTESLLQSKQGYQGLIYREAVENIQSYVESNRDKVHIFLGFNALNTSESQIIQELLQSDLAHVYWDIDEYFIEDPIHDVGFFLRQYQKDWSYFRNNSFNWKTSNYQKSKIIQVVGIGVHAWSVGGTNVVCSANTVCGCCGVRRRLCWQTVRDFCQIMGRLVCMSFCISCDCSCSSRPAASRTCYVINCDASHTEEKSAPLLQALLRTVKASRTGSSV